MEDNEKEKGEMQKTSKILMMIQRMLSRSFREMR
jgi:hypothetical protein